MIKYVVVLINIYIQTNCSQLVTYSTNKLLVKLVYQNIHHLTNHPVMLTPTLGPTESLW